MSSHYSYTYFTPYKAKPSYNPSLSYFLVYCGGHNPVKVSAIGRHEARAIAAKHFKVGIDKIRAVVPV